MKSNTETDNQSHEVQTSIGPDNTGTTENNGTAENTGDNQQLTSDEFDVLLKDTLNHGFCNKYDLFFIALIFCIALGIWVWGCKQPVPFILKRLLGMDPTLYPEQQK